MAAADAAAAAATVLDAAADDDGDTDGDDGCTVSLGQTSGAQGDEEMCNCCKGNGIMVQSITMFSRCTFIRIGFGQKQGTAES